MGQRRVDRVRPTWVGWQAVFATTSYVEANIMSEDRSLERYVETIAR